MEKVITDKDNRYDLMIALSRCKSKTLHMEETKTPMQIAQNVRGFLKYIRHDNDLALWQTASAVFIILIL
jgi:hypothetical protein